jgi:putative transposase
MSTPDRRAMVERPGKDLSVRRQCTLLNLARSGVYRPKPVPAADDLAVMRRIDELHLELPFYGSRRMMFELNKEGRGVNRKRVRRLMRVMGIEALVPRPGTSKAAPGHRIYPYLLRGLAITEPNHAWASDITYIPMAHGFLYLVAIIDWASRAVLAWRLSNTIDSGFCVEALEEALARHGKPRIFNTDQGAQFTSAAFTGKLEAAGVAISMDGRGRFMDNIFIERLWRSIKYEEVVCCGNLLRSGAGQLYRRWRKVLRRRSAGAVFKPPQAARVKSSRGERCWKRRGSPRQVCLMKTNVSEPLMTCRNLNSDVETRIWTSILRTRVGRCLLIAQPASGMKAA